MSQIRTLALVAIAWAWCHGPLGAEDRPLRQVIDEQIRATWQSQGVQPAEPASDAAFLRRIYLDLVGVIPSYNEAMAFFDNPSPTKRQDLIDQLMADERFARHQAEVWDLALFGRHPPGYQTDQRDGFLAWMQRQFAENVPYNRWVGELLQAKGNSVEQGAPMYLVQFRNAPEDAAVAITQNFLGIQLQCARCHDHPYEPWSQLDFHGMAAFLARLQVVDIGKKGSVTKWVIGEKNTGELLFTGPVMEQMPGQKGEPVKPKFLAGEALQEPPPPEGLQEPRNFPNGKVPPEPQFSRKDQLAAWVASPDNPYLARAVANRVWGQFMGRGLIHPVDNMSESNTATHPELLAALAQGLKDHNYDLKWYIRELVNSQAYQISSTGPDESAAPLWYQQARWRPLSAEELYDSWSTATGYAQSEAGQKAKGRFGGLTSGYMLRFFGEPVDGVGNFQGGLHEQLYLNNGELGRLITSDENGLLHVLIQSESPWEQRIDRLFISLLTRKPTDAEREKFVTYITAETDPGPRLREAIWALMTCSEFRFNH